MFVVFDIETTGFDSSVCEVIQFAYIMFDSNNNFVKSENLYFYHEGMHWSQEAADASHHLSLKFLKQYEADFKGNMLKMFSVLNRANVCGHNLIHFDCPFVKNWLQRQGLPGLEYGVVQDTMLAFRPITKRSRIKLTKLGEMLNLTDESIKYATSIWFNTSKDTTAHNASYDVALTALIALNGISRNLIKFDFSQITAEVESDSVELLESNNSVIDTPETKVADPNGYFVRLLMDGEDVYHFVNHDDTKYGDVFATEDMIESYKASNLYLPLQFRCTGDNHYTAEFEGITFSLDIGPHGDTMFLHSDVFDLSDLEVGMENIIKRNFS